MQLTWEILNPWQRTPFDSRHPVSEAVRALICNAFVPRYKLANEYIPNYTPGLGWNFSRGVDWALKAVHSHKFPQASATPEPEVLAYLAVINLPGYEAANETGSATGDKVCTVIEAGDEEEGFDVRMALKGFADLTTLDSPTAKFILDNWKEMPAQDLWFIAAGRDMPHEEDHLEPRLSSTWKQFEVELGGRKKRTTKKWLFRNATTGTNGSTIAGELAAYQSPEYCAIADRVYDVLRRYRKNRPLDEDSLVRILNAGLV